MDSIKRVLQTPMIWRARRRDRIAATSARHTLAACAIFREEAPFLREWIEFHCGVGFTHFYLYNNFSTDDFRQSLAPFIRDGLVTLVDWPVDVGQLPAYRDCLRRHSHDARWIGFFDIDEFVFSPVQRDIRPIMAEFEDYPGVHVWQYFFGSGGNATRPVAPLLDSFTRRAPWTTRTTVKTIVNPRAVHRVGVHTSKFLWGHSVDTLRRRVEDGTPPVFDLLRMNHYWSRSLEDLDQKIRRGDASTSAERNRAWHLALEAQFNDEIDTTIVPLAAAIRAGRSPDARNAGSQSAS